MYKTEGLVKCQVLYLKPIRMLYNLMFDIFKIPLRTLPRKQFVPVPLNIMGYCTGIGCHVVVITTQVLSYPVKRQIRTQQTRVQQYIFMFTKMSHVALCTADVHTTNLNYVQCVPQCLSLTGLPKYTHENNFCY